jgi:hypothetical protein
MPDPVAFEFETAKQLLRLLKKSKDGVFNSEVDDSIPLDHAPAFIWAYVPTTTTCTYDATVKAWIIGGATTCYPINSGVDAAGLMQWGKNNTDGIVTGGITCTTFTPKIASDQPAPSIGKGFYLGTIFGYNGSEQPRVLIGLPPVNPSGPGSTFDVVTGVVCHNDGSGIGVTTASLTTSDYDGAVFKNFLGLVDVVPKSFVGNASRIVMVNTAANALEFGPNFSGAPTAADFLGLTDTPNTYSGASYKSVICNLGNSGNANALDFATPNVTTTNSLVGGGNPNNASVFTTLQLLNDTPTPGTDKYYATTSAGVKGWRSLTLKGATDFPENYTSAGGKFLKVNSGATAVEFVGKLAAVNDVAAHTISNTSLSTVASSTQTAIDDLKTQVNLILARMRSQGLIS